MGRLLTVAWFVLVPITAVGAESGATLIGVLEHSEAGRIKARVAFEKLNGHWSPIKSEDKSASRRIEWNVCFNSKSLGKLESRETRTEETNAEVSAQTIPESAKTPVVGKPGREFSGFLGEPVFRPLILTSAINCTDPDNWKTFTQGSEAFRSSAQLAIKNLDKVELYKCGTSTGEKPGKIGVKDIAPDESYHNAQGAELSAVKLKGSANVCDVAGDPFQYLFWTYRSARGQVQFLDYALRLIDAGDYDNSGHSSVIFMREGENRGGYIIYSEDFSKPAEFSWHYH